MIFESTIGCRTMKPTIKQVVAHFGLPDEALESYVLKMMLNDTNCDVDDVDFLFEDAMNKMAGHFHWVYGRPITDWFKPNDGEGG